MIETALDIIAYVVRRPCKLCKQTKDVNRQLHAWFTERVDSETIADRLHDAGIKVSHLVVLRHRKHIRQALLAAAEKVTNGHHDELKSLQMQLDIERKKVAQMELARAGEERIRAALDALRSNVSADKMRQIEEILKS